MYDISSHKLAEAGSNSLTRLEVSDVLMNEFHYAKQAWELERDALINQAVRVRVFSSPNCSG
jgi:hypothetical protein